MFTSSDATAKLALPIAAAISTYISSVREGDRYLRMYATKSLSHIQRTVDQQLVGNRLPQEHTASAITPPCSEKERKKRKRKKKERKKEKDILRIPLPSGGFTATTYKVLCGYVYLFPVRRYRCTHTYCADIDAHTHTHIDTYRACSHLSANLQLAPAS